MGKFRKKPVVIEAWRLPPIEANPSKELVEFLHDNNIESDRNGGVAIPTLEGTMRGDPGDWIIKGVKGEVYPCKPDIFEATYEEVNEDTGNGYHSFASDNNSGNASFCPTEDR